MSYATTHIIFSMLGVDSIRKYSNGFKRILPKYYLFLAAIGGLIPDLDIVAYYILYFFGYSFEAVHRTFMHSIFIPLGLFLIGILIYFVGGKGGKRGKVEKIYGVFFIFTIGCLIHLLLDAIGGSFILFYPLSSFSIGLNLLDYFPEKLKWLIPPIVEGLVLLAWIFWMNVKLKKNDFFSKH